MVARRGEQERHEQHHGADADDQPFALAVEQVADEQEREQRRGVARGDEQAGLGGGKVEVALQEPGQRREAQERERGRGLRGRRRGQHQPAVGGFVLRAGVSGHRFTLPLSAGAGEGSGRGGETRRLSRCVMMSNSIKLRCKSSINGPSAAQFRHHIKCRGSPLLGSARCRIAFKGQRFDLDQGVRTRMSSLIT